MQIPHVNRTDYQLIDISEDGFVWLLLVLFDCFGCDFYFAVHCLVSVSVSVSDFVVADVIGEFAD